jgi:hypothetical protein
VGSAQGHSILLLACERIADGEVSRAPLDVTEDFDGWTALHYAAANLEHGCHQHEREDLVSLVRAGADLSVKSTKQFWYGVEVDVPEGSTPLDVAAVAVEEADSSGWSSADDIEPHRWCRLLCKTHTSRTAPIPSSSSRPRRKCFTRRASVSGALRGPHDSSLKRTGYLRLRRALSPVLKASGSDDDDDVPIGLAHKAKRQRLLIHDNMHRTRVDGIKCEHCTYINSARKASKTKRCSNCRRGLFSNLLIGTHHSMTSGRGPQQRIRPRA